MRILGVDEAGRGCVIGPLVIAGVLMDQESRSRLLELGVKDSKLLSRRQREHIAKGIEQIAIRIHVVRIPPVIIDRAVRSHRKLHKLNRLEAKTMANIIQVLRPDIAFVDASDVLPHRYKQHISECLSFPVELISEHKADAKYPIVSAASIIAKVERDHIIDELKSQHGDFGSGYMADPKTIIFLESLAENSEVYPSFVRQSWKPAKAARMRAKMRQCRLQDLARV